MLYDYPPPKNTLGKWLDQISKTKGRLGHLLLEQRDGIDLEAVCNGLQPYFESAHLDARKRFHDFVQIDLHPDATSGGPHHQYPNSLPWNVISGYFGEVTAGLVVQAYDLVGNHKWEIPVFLFQEDGDAQQRIFELVGGSRKSSDRKLPGRRGSDCVAIVISKSGTVERVLMGEAKWRSTLRPSDVKTIMHGDNNKRGVYADLNANTEMPYGLMQLAKILMEMEQPKYDPTIESIFNAWKNKDTSPLPRTDLVLIAGNRAVRRKKGDTNLPTSVIPKDYKPKDRNLQFVELVLENGNDLITNLYHTLYDKEKDDGA